MCKKPKILLIAPSTYGFYIHIIGALEKHGYQVDFIDEHIRINSIFLRKIIFKLPRYILEFLHFNYIKKNLENTVYDRVIMIRGEYITSEILCWLKNKIKSAKFFLYQWDFQNNLHLFESQIPFFDKVFSFDKVDSEKYKLIHKPLFFNQNHKDAIKNSCSYSFNFIGTDHSDRAAFISRFIKSNNLSRNTFFLHLYRSRLSILLNTLKNPFFLRNKDLSLYTYYPLPEKETLDKLSRSKVIIDITQPGQSGLTMRTLESIGLKKKLITTNESIRNYDFFNPDNILIISNENMKIDEHFINSNYKNIKSEIYDKYYVDNWVLDFL